jgi:hypothetical protein
MEGPPNPPHVSWSPPQPSLGHPSQLGDVPSPAWDHTGDSLAVSTSPVEIGEQAPAADRAQPFPADDLFNSLNAHPGRPDVLTAWIDPSLVVQSTADFDVGNGDSLAFFWFPVAPEPAGT